MASLDPILLIHCGTGSELVPASREFFRELLPELSRRLLRSTNALDLAVECVSRLEASGLFNAGQGAIAQGDGEIRRDAGMMDGASMKALGISQVRGVPGMARLVAALHGKSAHVHLAGAMVERWAKRNGWPEAGRGEESGSDPTRLWEEEGGTGSGTVGCVVRDSAGHLASVTSTGGIGRMWPGRIGDSPIVGGGFYADDTLGAISMTGVGEAILTAGGGVALLVGLSLTPPGPGAEAVSSRALDRLRIIQNRFGAETGCVGISGGEPFFAHTSPRMIRGVVTPDRVLVADRAGEMRDSDPV